MNIKEIIDVKKNKGELTKKEIDFFVKGYTNGSIPDYQASALIMAIFLNGLNESEIKDLTYSMVESGEKIEFPGDIVDKHSTGGVGDTVTLVLMPILASLGYKVAKMSGRGLGYTGGTIDKLESIPGYIVDQDIEKIKDTVDRIGLSLTSQTNNLVPADKKIYSLRDSIACTDSLPLIASSIMSKKIASGANNIVLDITCGNGAFMKNFDDAKKLADIMESLASSKIKVSSVITAMNEPLGYAVGNLLEIKEAIDILNGKNIPDVLEVVYSLAYRLMEREYTKDEIRKKIDLSITEKAGYNKFKELVKIYGGDVEFLDKLKNNNYEDVQEIKYVKKYTINVEKEMWIKEISAIDVAKASFALGAGRVKKEDNIDYAVGVVLNKKIGHKLEKGENILAYIYSNDEQKTKEAEKYLNRAYVFSNEKIDIPNVVLSK